MQSDTTHSPLSSDPRARICGNSAVTSCTLADLCGYWTLEFGRLSLSPWTPQVELDRKQFFAIELDFKIVLRDRAIVPGSSRTRARSAKSLPKSTFSAIGEVGLERAASDKTLG